MTRVNIYERLLVAEDFWRKAWCLKCKSCFTYFTCFALNVAGTCSWTKELCNLDSLLPIMVDACIMAAWKKVLPLPLSQGWPWHLLTRETFSWLYTCMHTHTCICTHMQTHTGMCVHTHIHTFWTLASIHIKGVWVLFKPYPTKGRESKKTGKSGCLVYGEQ